MEVFRLLLLVSVAMSSVGGERILAMFPILGKSHFFFFESVLEELAKRGHDVTVVSQFPRAKPLDHYTDINVRKKGVNEITVNLGEVGLMGKKIKETMSAIFTGFEAVFQDPRIENILNSTTKYDLIMTEVFLTDMYVGLSHRFQAPLVEMVSSVVLPWASDRFAIPDNPSYIHTSIDKGSGPMSFSERLVNCIELVVTKSLYSYFITSNDERVSKTYLGADTPHVKEMMKKTSLFLVNSHFTLNGARPFPPQVVEVGGVHIKPAKPLPEVFI